MIQSIKDAFSFGSAATEPQSPSAGQPQSYPQQLSSGYGLTVPAIQSQPQSQTAGFGMSSQMGMGGQMGGNCYNPCWQPCQPCQMQGGQQNASYAAVQSPVQSSYAPSQASSPIVQGRVEELPVQIPQAKTQSEFIKVKRKVIEYDEEVVEEMVPVKNIVYEEKKMTRQVPVERKIQDYYKIETITEFKPQAKQVAASAPVPVTKTVKVPQYIPVEKEVIHFSEGLFEEIRKGTIVLQPEVLERFRRAETGQILRWQEVEEIERGGKRMPTISATSRIVPDADVSQDQSRMLAAMSAQQKQASQPISSSLGWTDQLQDQARRMTAGTTNQTQPTATFQSAGTTSPTFNWGTGGNLMPQQTTQQQQNSPINVAGTSSLQPASSLNWTTGTNAPQTGYQTTATIQPAGKLPVSGTMQPSGTTMTMQQPSGTMSMQQPSGTMSMQQPSGTMSMQGPTMGPSGSNTLMRQPTPSSLLPDSIGKLWP